jgi:hypothetical protein
MLLNIIASLFSILRLACQGLMQRISQATETV